MMRRLWFVVLSSLLLLQTSCQIKPPHYETPADVAQRDLEKAKNGTTQELKDKANKALPPAIQSALVPQSIVYSGSAYNNLYNKRFTINVDNIAAPTFFKNLSKGTPYNVVVDPKVTGNISLHLQSVTMPEIFQAVRDLYGYEYIKTNYGFNVLAPKLQTRLFRVNYLDMKRSSTTTTSLSASDLISAGAVTDSNDSSGSSTPTTTTPKSPDVTNTVQSTSTINFWDALSDNLKALIGTADGRSVTINSSSGVVIIRAYPNELRQVSEFLDRMQSNMNRQVILEVSILQVQLNDAFQAGIDWKLLGLETTMGSSLGLASPLAYSTVTATDDSNRAIMKLLQQQGTVQVLSNPRVLTVNNQQSVIKVGAEAYYVTSVTSTPVSTSTGTTTSSASVGMTPFFSGITLNITPQIDYNSEVMLHVHPTVTVVQQETKTINLGSSGTMELPTAAETVREYDSIVRASNNQLVVIGGMITNELDEKVSGTPGLSKIPFFGALFRANTQSADKFEMVIILRPLLVTEHPKELEQQLDKTRRGLMRLNRGFHQGGISEMMGNQGEQTDELY